MVVSGPAGVGRTTVVGALVRRQVLEGLSGDLWWGCAARRCGGRRRRARLGRAVVDAAPRDLVLVVDVPAVRGGQAGDQVQAEASLSSVAAHRGHRRLVGRGIADLE